MTPPDAAEVQVTAQGVAAAVAPAGGLTDVQRVLIEALFPAMSDDPHASNDTYFRWSELLARGFPYVKASVLREFGAHPQLRAATAAARSSA